MSQAVYLRDYGSNLRTRKVDSNCNYLTRVVKYNYAVTIELQVQVSRAERKYFVDKNGR